MLQNWPIRSKLAAILVVPLLTLALLSGYQVRSNLSNVSASNSVRDLAAFSIKVNDLISVLQDERNAVASYVGGGYPANQRAGAASGRQAVTAALTTYQQGIAGLPASTRSRLGTAQSTVSAQLAKLPAVRRQIDARTARNLPTSSYYTQAISDLLSLDAEVSSGSNNAELINGAGALTSAAQANEAVNQEFGYTSEIVFLGAVSPATVKLVETSAGAEQAWLTQFHSTASAAQRSFYTRTLGSSDHAMSVLRDQALAQAQQSGGRVTVNPALWLTTSKTKLKNLRTVELKLSNDLRSRSTSLASAANRRAWSGGLLTLLILVLSVGISLLVASPMVRQLRRLRAGALEVANERLPSLVERLHQGKRVDPDSETFPVLVTSRDEIGQVAAAFATVHEVAVRTAVEQAAMRKSIGDTFLNLARRSQSLVHRQLKVIDKLERKETDPDELEDLFRLDHLATRMRRHAEDLIVLSGSKPARGWRRPVAIKDVVRGAVAEVEDYTRVKVLPVTGAPVSGHAVGDVIHLLAELVENATSFSPPHTPVNISGHEVSNGCVVEIEDRGLGMTEDEFAQINHRLANPPPFDLSTSERLGLFVVGRLAERHGIRVRLRPSPYGGTLAIVLLPSALLRPQDPEFIQSDDEDTASTSATLLDQAEVYTSDATVPVDSHDRDSPLTDDLPVFATVRSSWFVNERGEGAYASGGANGSANGAFGLPSGAGDEGPGRRALEPGNSNGNGRGSVNGSGSVFGRGPVDPPGNRTPSFGDRGSAFGDRGSAFGGGSTFGGGSAFGRDRSLEGNGTFEPESSFERDQRDQPSERAGSFGSDSGLGGGPAFDNDAPPAARTGFTWDDPPTYERDQRASDDPRYLPGPPTPGPGPSFREDPPAPNRTTEVGLPKRKRRASLAPELRAETLAPADPANSPAPGGRPLLAGARSPDEIRSMMSSFQSNFGRGIQDGSQTFDDNEIQE